MQAHSTNSPKRASANTRTADGRAKRSARKRVPIDAEMLAGMTGVLINEALAAGLPVRTGKGRTGGLLLALDALTLDDAGLVIARPKENSNENDDNNDGSATQ